MENDIVAIPRAQYQRWCRRFNDNQLNEYDNPASSSSSMILTDTEAAASFRSVWRLPPELLLEILSYLSDRQSTLYNVSLVCRQWFLCATPILYKHAKIHNTYRWATFILTLGRDKRLFHYGSLAQSIDLSCGKDSEATKPKEQETARATRMVVTTSTTQNPRQTTTTLTRTTMNNVNIIIEETNTDTDMDNGQRIDLAATRDATADINPRAAENDTTYELYDVISEEDGHIAFHTAPSLVVSTSSLVQLAQCCQNLVSIDLSYTHMFYDSMIAETGEYISTLQNYAIQPGLTHVKIPLETAISTIGHQCTQLEQIKIQSCGWVSARIIWLWACSCPNLTYLDARRSSKCSVKRLTTAVLQVAKGPRQQQRQSLQQQQQLPPTSSSSSVSSSSSPRNSLPPSSPPTASVSTSSISSSVSSSSDSTQDSNAGPSTSDRASSSNTAPTTSSNAGPSTSDSSGPSNSDRASSSNTGSSTSDRASSSNTIPSTFDRATFNNTEESSSDDDSSSETMGPTSGEQDHHRGLLDEEITEEMELTAIRYIREQHRRGNFHSGFRPGYRLRRFRGDPNPDQRMAESRQQNWMDIDTDHIRPPSPNSRTAQNNLAEPEPAPLSQLSLRDYVWSILKEGKDQGLMELQWLQD